MTKWSKYQAEQVRIGKDENGQRLALLFSKDYELKFGEAINCLTCKEGFKNKFNKYLEIMSDKKKKAGQFLLKPRYNGISLGRFKRKVVTNDNITEEDAKHLILNHPKATELFYKLPKGFVSGLDVDEPESETVTDPDADPDSEPQNDSVDLKKLTKAELIEFADKGGIEIDATKTKAEIIDQIEA